MPEGVVNFCPGAGASFGDAVVAHPKTRYIAFTGSREVGLHINKVAATQAPGQIWIKRTILEMGGKDAIIVDADADIDSAVEGVAQSAFGFQGQKCSACSRAIVDERIYDKFLEQLKARVEKIQVGDPAENANMGAVINEGSMKTILDYIEQGKKDGRLITGGERATSWRRLLHPAHRDCRHPAEVETRAGRNLRPGAGRDQSPRLRPRARNRQRHRIRPDRRGLHQVARQDRPRHPANSTSATCTSTANAPAPWWARIPSAASTCRAPIPSPAARIICTCSRKRNRWEKKSVSVFLGQRDGQRIPLRELPLMPVGINRRHVAGAIQLGDLLRR